MAISDISSNLFVLRPFSQLITANGTYYSSIVDTADFNDGLYFTAERIQNVSVGFYTVRIQESDTTTPSDFTTVTDPNQFISNEDPQSPFAGIEHTSITLNIASLEQVKKLGVISTKRYVRFEVGAGTLIPGSEAVINVHCTLSADIAPQYEPSLIN